MVDQWFFEMAEPGSDLRKEAANEGPSLSFIALRDKLKLQYGVRTVKFEGKTRQVASLQGLNSLKEGQ